MVELFFSYSHRDEELRNELEKHLSGLQRKGVIASWHDRRIVAGDDFGGEISKHLESSHIILLLVSSDFIASDYCYDIEMKRAMEKHSSGTAHVIPVILRPCDWKDLPFGDLLATPTDGKAITKFANQDDAFLEVTLAIKEAAKRFQKQSNRTTDIEPSGGVASGNPQGLRQPNPRSSNLRIKKVFTDQERDRFEIEAFEYIANFFESSLSELKARNPEIEATFRRVDANTFTAVIYRNGSELNSCKIGFSTDQFFRGIAYSQSIRKNSGINDSVSAVDDGYSLFLQPMALFNFDSDKNQKLTLEGGAEYFWDKFIQPLQY